MAAQGHLSDLLQVVLLALFPALGNFGGGLVAEFTRTSRRTLSLALHAAAGIIFGVIALELAPRAFDGAPAWLAAVGLVTGGCFFLFLERIVHRLGGGNDDGGDGTGAANGQGRSGAWVIYAAVAVDLFSDGLLIGTGSSLSFTLAMVLALGQVTADIPEGFATIANFKDKGVPRATRLMLAGSFVAPVVLGALLAYFLLRGRPEAVQLTALAFTAGLLLVAAVEEIIGEAHEAAPDTPAAALSIVAGFALFGLVSAYFGGG